MISRLFIARDGELHRFTIYLTNKKIFEKQPVHNDPKAFATKIIINIHLFNGTLRVPKYM